MMIFLSVQVSSSYLHVLSEFESLCVILKGKYELDDEVFDLNLHMLCKDG